MYAQPTERASRVTTVDLTLDEHAHRAWIRSLAEVAPVFEMMEARMLDLGYPRIDRFAVNLVLREAALHALENGHDGDPDKTLQITFAVRPDEVVIDVEDQCAGFSPKSEPQPRLNDGRRRPRGWSAFLTKSYASWLEVEPTGNRLSFGRRRSNV